MNVAIQAFYLNLFKSYTKTGKRKGVIKGNKGKIDLV